MKKIFNPIILLMLFIVAGMTIQSYSWDKNNLTDAVLILPSIFSNNMVLQRDKPLPIWGKCSPAEEIIVEFNGQVNKATADSDGNWKIILDPVKAGGPYKLQVLGKEKRIYENVLVGEVWLCSGQSNMEMPVFGSWAKVDNYEEVIKNADYPNIRLLTVKKSTSTIPLDDVETEGWVQCSPKTIPEFSAVAYFFGKDIHINHDVPVGLIHSSWGGTVAEAWTSPSSLKTLDDFKKSVNEIEQLPRDKSKMYEIYNKEFLNWEKTIRGKDRGMSKTDTIWKKPDLDDRDWKKMKLPTIWEDG
ncbi:MAG: 9-O-acetylesterase, partial [Calditrichia bacterium]|nr:9-O-acetylesterase [Calditrichia bacterium]